MRNVFTMVLVLLSSIVFAQTRKITGKITNNGVPLSEATVTVKSSGFGTSTGIDGYFTVTVATTDELEISHIGYTTKTVSINSKTTSLNINVESTAENLKEVVVVGSRRAGRVKTESAVPVDIISVAQVGQSSAKTDITSILNMAAPSLNYNKQSGSDGADAIDLATLRGLGPDQTLVLINGKRQHQTAFVALFGTRGRGNSGTDLNAIPASSIDKVEILRDGASAQYGSDAIAGVINLILKKDVNHLNISAGWSGYYDHKYNTINNTQSNQYLTNHQIDGQTFNLGASYGLPIGKKGGYINFAGNFATQGKTFRQVSDTNYSTNSNALPINTGRRANGDASLVSGGGTYNASIPLGHSSTSFYSFGSINHKASSAYAYSRNFSSSPARFPTYANGNYAYVDGITQGVTNSAFNNPTSGNDVFFNPIEIAHIDDGSVAVGLKGKCSGDWDWDLSNTYGKNNFHYFGDKTFNASLGVDGINKTHFDDGGFSFLQNTTNADFSKNYATIASGLNVSFGAEYRFEQYQIYRGEEASYKNYDPNKATGAQGFPGFQPADEVKANRTNAGIYADVELDVTKKWLIDGAIRVENYSDFGSLATYKFATRYKVSSNFNVRGSVSTGYRAPSLQQINFSNTYTNVQNGKIFEVKIAPNYSPITKAAGIPNLKQEKSVNASLGFSWQPIKNLTFTVDGYMVKIKDRVVLTGQFDNTNTALKPILDSLNVSQAQFFANAANTTNYGVDVVIDYTKRWGTHSLKFLLAGNVQHMNIDQINVPNALNSNPEAFFSQREQKFVLASAPPVKLSSTIEYGIKKFTVGTHLTYFGKVELMGYSDGTVPLDANPTVMVPENFVYNGKLVTDVYVGYKLFKKATLNVGIDNLFNIHPDLGIVKGANSLAYDGEAGGPWDAVQMGTNGLRLFSKLSFNF